VVGLPHVERLAGKDVHRSIDPIGILSNVGVNTLTSDNFT